MLIPYTINTPVYYPWTVWAFTLTVELSRIDPTDNSSSLCYFRANLPIVMSLLT